jgi:secreted trypsin-like serine protease
MNSYGTALQRVCVAGAAAGLLWGLGMVGPPLAQGVLPRASPGLVAGPPPMALDSAPRGPVANTSIVDGSNASITEFPFQVALYDPRLGSPEKGFFCGGVILSATRVATAAHCLLAEGGRRSPPAEIEVLAGSTYLEPTEAGSVRDAVAATAIDSGYNPVTSDYDVGILSLARPLWSGPTPALNGLSAIAALPPDAVLADRLSAATLAGQENAPAVQAMVSGWGDLNPEPGGALSYPRRLHKASVPLVATAACEADYATIEQVITPRMLCAGARADSCYGDSGGPLVLTGESGAAQPAGDVLIGLVDFGDGCAQAGFPGVYVQTADPAIGDFLRTGPPQASAGGVQRGVCPRLRSAASRSGLRGRSRRKHRCRRLSR